MTFLVPQRILPAMTRPNPLLWIWYTLGGRLGPATATGCCTTPPAAPAGCARPCGRGSGRATRGGGIGGAGSQRIVWAAVGLGLLLALWYSLAYINSTAERRLVKHGYEPGTLKLMLRERDHREHADRSCATCRPIGRLVGRGPHPARRRRMRRTFRWPCISASRSSERSSAVRGPPPLSRLARRGLVVVATAAQPVTIAGIDPHRPLGAAADADHALDVLALLAPGRRVYPTRARRLGTSGTWPQ